MTEGADSLILIGDANAAHAIHCREAPFAAALDGLLKGKIRVPYGSLIDEPALKPMAHMFVGSKAAWHVIHDDLPQHDEYPWVVTGRGG